MTSTTAAPALAVTGLARTFGTGAGAVRALAGVDLAFPAGSFTAVMGPSGSGKSTFLTCASGLDRPTEGRVLIDGQDITAWDENRRTTLPARADRLRLPGLPPDALPHRRAERRPPAAARRPPARPGQGPRRCSRRSASATAAATCPASCPAASSSGSRSPGRWSPTPPSCSLTSRPARSTPTPPTRCWPCCASCVDDLGPDRRDGHPRPRRGVVRRRGGLPRRRPRRRPHGATPPPTPWPARWPTSTSSSHCGAAS